MSYQVLARKWRPQRFSDVLGQLHITRTLQNAISRDRVGHAYLFVGPRGIGKTTSARIFAKALNCTNPATDADGHIEPCCECETCCEIAAGNCLDVLEIDGASHNGVEHIRDLRDNVQYSPTNNRKYRVYIIDEVHMLSTQAWNALLKTLEEPPPHVKFLFATTEAHKVLATILSRCQRFDLKRIPVPIIVDHLRAIAARESVYIDDNALTVIARAAEGGMRDAQSIFDQMIAFCGGDSEAEPISEANVMEVFGLASGTELATLTSALINNDAAAVVSTIHTLANRGSDLERLFADVLGYLRNVMIAQLATAPEHILELGENELVACRDLAGHASPDIIQRLVDGLLGDDGGIRFTLNKRLFMEATFLRVMRDAHSVQIDDIITALRHFQENGTLPDLPLPPTPATTSVTPPSTQESTSNPTPAPDTSTPMTDSVPETHPMDSSATASTLNAPVPPTAAELQPRHSGTTAAPFTPASDAVASTDVKPGTPTHVPPSQPPNADAPNLISDETVNVRPAADSQPSESTTVEPRPSAPLAASMDSRVIWQRMIAALEDTDTELASLLGAATPLSWDGGALVIGVPPNTAATALTDIAMQRRLLPALASAAAVIEPTLRVDTLEADNERRLVASKEVWDSLEKNPFVQKVCSVFNGRIVDVRGL